MAKKKGANPFGIGLLLGAAAGYAVSYFIAPKPGDELKEDLSDRAAQLKQSTEQTIEKIKQDNQGNSEQGVGASRDPLQDHLPTTSRAMPPEESVSSDMLVQRSDRNILDSSVEKGTPIDK